MLSGKKTYIVAGLFLVYAGIGFLLGEIDGPEAMRIALEGGGFAALRNGVAKKIGV